MAYQSNLLGDFWTSYRQRRATGGRSLTSAEMRGLLDPVMAADAQKAIAAGERERVQSNFNRQMSMQEQAQRDAARAASVGGAAQIGGLLGQGYLTYKGLGIASQQAQATNNLTAALLGGGGGTAGQGAANFLGGAAPALGGGAANTIAPVLSTPTTFAPSMLAAEGAGAAAPAATGMGAGPAGLIGSGIGYGVAKMFGANEDITQAATLGGAGIGVGFMVGGPVGAAIGGLIGVGASFLDDIF